MLSGVTTSHTPLWVADVHRASSLELLLTMSSDRQLVLTRHDLHQLLAKTDTSPDHTPRRRPFPIRARIRAHVLGTPALPESNWKVRTGADDCVSSGANVCGRGRTRRILADEGAAVLSPRALCPVEWARQVARANRDERCRWECGAREGFQRGGAARRHRGRNRV